MALILADLRLSGKAPISRDSEKIDTKGKAICDEASLRKRDRITNLHNKIVYVLLRSQHSNMYFCVHNRSQMSSHKNAFCTLVYTTEYPENSWVQ